MLPILSKGQIHHSRGLDQAKIDAIEQKLLANPEIAKLIDELGTSTTDANDLVRGMLQASITRGLNAEMDAHLGYSSGCLLYTSDAADE